MYINLRVIKLCVPSLEAESSHICWQAPRKSMLHVERFCMSTCVTTGSSCFSLEWQKAARVKHGLALMLICYLVRCETQPRNFQHNLRPCRFTVKRLWLQSWVCPARLPPVGVTVLYHDRWWPCPDRRLFTSIKDTQLRPLAFKAVNAETFLLTF